MKPSDLTFLEIEYCEIVCNFTADELQLFRLRCQDIPLEECAEIMHRGIDSVKQLSRRINSKLRSA